MSVYQAALWDTHVTDCTLYPHACTSGELSMIVMHCHRSLTVQTIVIVLFTFMRVLDL